MTFEKWISPSSRKKISLLNELYSDGELFFPVENGIPNFIYPQNLSGKDNESKQFYDGRSDDYEKYLHLTFETYGENELEVRNKMIDLLELKDGDRIIEVAAGTGRDSVLIDQRLSEKSEFHITDISADMLLKAKIKLKNSNSKTIFCLANAMHLPYEDNYFDAFYSFGALGEFSDAKTFFKEVVRICKPGAKVVVGDENLPIWQKETLFGKILSNYNKQFLEEVPFKSLPVEAREVRCQWIIGGVFYLIDFRVGVGEPSANFDFKIPGARGGTHKTRYFGQLEGVSEKTKKLAWAAQKKLNISMHDWLDSIVEKEAKKILGESND